MNPSNETKRILCGVQANRTRMVYRMLRYAIKYVDRGARLHQVQQRTRGIRRVKHKAANLGFQPVQAPAA
jgi:hypothetical protein